MKKRYVGENDYSEGQTELNPKQRRQLESISKLLNGPSDNYNNLPRKYGSQDLIAILINQVKTKLDNGMIDEFDAKEAKAMISMLEIMLTQDNS